MTDAEAGVRRRTLSIRMAALIGVGSMVGAGMLSLLAAVGEFAGPDVWLLLLLTGAVAAPQGYSSAKFDTHYLSAGGLLECDRGRCGNGHSTGTMAWLILSANANVISPATDHRDRRDLCPKHRNRSDLETTPPVNRGLLTHCSPNTLPALRLVHVTETKGV